MATAGVEKATWVFAPEGHGKGVCDGQGGRITGWLNTIAKKTVVSTLVQFCRLLSKSAEAAEALNPGGPKSRFHLFKPPPKATLPKCYVDTKGLNEGGAPIRSIYAWSFTMNSSKMRPVSKGNNGNKRLHTLNVAVNYPRKYSATWPVHSVARPDARRSESRARS